jgi:hypothetical protein
MGKSAEVLRLALRRCAPSRLAQDDKLNKPVALLRMRNGEWGRKGRGRVQNSSVSRWLAGKVQGSFDSRSVASLPRASLRMTKLKSERFDQDDKLRKVSASLRMRNEEMGSQAKGTVRIP